MEGSTRNCVTKILFSNSEAMSGDIYKAMPMADKEAIKYAKHAKPYPAPKDKYTEVFNSDTLIPLYEIFCT